MEGKKVLDGLFFGNEVKISGSQGEKSAQPSQKNGKKKKKTKPKAERLVMERADGGAGHRMVQRHQNAHGENLALFVSVTEWVLAGQQTAICKHHEGKHQSTLDFLCFFIIFFFL